MTTPNTIENFDDESFAIDFEESIDFDYNDLDGIDMTDTIDFDYRD